MGEFLAAFSLQKAKMKNFKNEMKELTVLIY